MGKSGKYGRVWGIGANADYRGWGRKLNLLPKVRAKNRKNRSQIVYNTAFYCERCRIKDGLPSTNLYYATCSFCGRVGRMNIGSGGGFVRGYSGNTVVSKKGNVWRRWNRGPKTWEGMQGSRKRGKS